MNMETTEIPLADLQEVILKETLDERITLMWEIAHKYQVMYVRILARMRELIGEEEYKKRFL
jgi:hypothetical protein